MLPARGVSTAYRVWTKFGRVGDLSNVITHAKFEINWYKIVTLAKGWSFMFQHYTADAINTAKPCRAACDTSREAVHRNTASDHINTPDIIVKKLVIQLLK